MCRSKLKHSSFEVLENWNEPVGYGQCHDRLHS